MMLILLLISFLNANEIKFSTNKVKTGEVFGFELYSKQIPIQFDKSNIKLDSRCLMFFVNGIERRDTVTKIYGDVVAFDQCQNNSQLNLVLADQKSPVNSADLMVDTEGIDDKKLDQFIVMDSAYIDDFWLRIILIFAGLLISFGVLMYFRYKSRPKQSLSLNEKIVNKINKVSTISDLKDLYTVFQYIDLDEEKQRIKNEIAEKIFSPNLNELQIEQLKDYYRKLTHD
jgi:hypothetical protein